jgi:serine phosphatase RsbU (regulator of sigma subunit)
LAFVSAAPDSRTVEAAEADPQRETRLQSLAALRLLDTPREERFDRIVRLTQRMFDVPTVVVSLIDERRQYNKAEVGAGKDEVPIADSFCRYTVLDDSPFVVEAPEHDPRFVGNGMVADGLRFYAGQPLKAPNGVRVGALCIADDRARRLDDDQLDLLRQLADIAEAELALTDELNRAGDVQRRLLPRRVPALPGYTVAGTCVPAQAVGGDFFDWFPARDGYQFVVADVMGKGMAAALVGAGARAVLRGTSQFNDLETSVHRTDISMADDLEEISSFITMFVARLDYHSHVLSYIDCGHGIAGVVRADGTAQRFVSDSMPVGLLDFRRAAREVQLAPGDTFICLSDGLLDLFDTIEDAIEAARVTVVDYPDPAEAVKVVEEYAREHAASDDITCIVVRRDEQ